MTNEMNDKDLDYAAFKKDLVKELFWVYQNGELDKYVRIQARRFTRLAVKKGEVRGNVLDVTGIFSTIAWTRDTAARALPNGETMFATRSEIEAHHGETMDWNHFFGLDKKKVAEY